MSLKTYELNENIYILMSQLDRKFKSNFFTGLTNILSTKNFKKNKDSENFSKLTDKEFERLLSAALEQFASLSFRSNVKKYDVKQSNFVSIYKNGTFLQYLLTVHPQALSSKGLVLLNNLGVDFTASITYDESVAETPHKTTLDLLKSVREDLVLHAKSIIELQKLIINPKAELRNFVTALGELQEKDTEAYRYFITNIKPSEAFPTLPVFMLSQGECMQTILDHVINDLGGLKKTKELSQVPVLSRVFNPSNKDQVIAYLKKAYQRQNTKDKFSEKSVYAQVVLSKNVDLFNAVVEDLGKEHGKEYKKYPKILGANFAHFILSAAVEGLISQEACVEMTKRLHAKCPGLYEETHKYGKMVIFQTGITPLEFIHGTKPSLLNNTALARQSKSLDLNDRRYLATRIGNTLKIKSTIPEVPPLNEEKKSEKNKFNNNRSNDNVTSAISHFSRAPTGTSTLFQANRKKKPVDLNNQGFIFLDSLKNEVQENNVQKVENESYNLLKEKYESLRLTAVKSISLLKNIEDIPLGFVVSEIKKVVNALQEAVGKDQESENNNQQSHFNKK